MNTGKESEAIFEAVLTELGAFVNRISDAFEERTKRRLTTRKPSDFIVTHQGKTWYAEVKSISEKDRFSFSAIQPEQFRVASNVRRTGGEYIFYLHFIAFNRWFKVPAERILNSEKKSLTIRDVEGLEIFFPPTTP